MYDEPSSGNLYRPPRHGAQRQKIAVQVESRVQEGLELPCRITWRVQRTFRVDRVFGCKRDPETGDLEYAIRIGSRTTKLWRRPDGTYYVLRKK
ncbi:MAG: hypothetical protein IJ452_01400 [Butyricicoccus sp.]|nr:hypothetical protein [Butyricicoccus sp.]MBQ8584923.1 hypothetical protein [Butyricicoccus sp.]